MSAVSAWTGSEADLCAAFIAAATVPDRRGRRSQEWSAYPETAGFDILLVRQSDGVQIGIEAKLTLNARVIAQALPYREGWRYGGSEGPDFRAVLVPAGRCNADLERLCSALGITVIRFMTHDPDAGRWAVPFMPCLPCEETANGLSDWYEWAPIKRCEVPDYIPDVKAGCSAPVALTAWKVKAIRLSILLEDRAVSRADFKALELSPTNWLCPNGWLERGEAGWVRGSRTPDFERQHPRNYAEIKADRARWEPKPPPAAAPALKQGALL